MMICHRHFGRTFELHVQGSVQVHDHNFLGDCNDRLPCNRIQTKMDGQHSQAFLRRRLGAKQKRLLAGAETLEWDQIVQNHFVFTRAFTELTLIDKFPAAGA